MDPQSSKLFKGDCKGRTISHVTIIMDLSSEIMSEILSRLPIKSVYCCKAVCKLWYNLLTSDPLFSNMYHKRTSSNFPNLLLSIGDYVQFLLELKPNDPYPLKSTTVLSPKFHLHSPNMRLIGSCNGFVCLLKGWMYDLDHSVYISNPLLGEYFKVKLPKQEKRTRVAYAFCFSEASRQYKVLRSAVRSSDRHPQVSELEVYTLGVDENGDMWARLHNLYMYHLVSRTEEVKSLLAPHGLGTPSYNLTLVELGNCLCLCNRNDSEYVDIWWMKEYEIAKSWTKTCILKDTIQSNIRCDVFIPISTWKDGEILMQRLKITLDINRVATFQVFTHSRLSLEKVLKSHMLIQRLT
ncbi:hypothetical protein H5410_025166 [Solanum commersonii]|uniref:F-box domain-containing protein n=1 Tax=Solanum commersonii TaxID=4109 RepID=A0A9J5YTH4_SOLCO|nr:hypothetical protein H5410_025166 [Solanum commersonii]